MVGTQLYKGSRNWLKCSATLLIFENLDNIYLNAFKLAKSRSF